jgi:hypothetical protein
MVMREPSQQDQRDAIEAVSMNHDLDLDRRQFDLAYLGCWSASEILAQDGGGWAELGWDPKATEREREIELYHFRGSGWARKAKGWMREDNIPPVVFVRFQDEDGRWHMELGDGRGRTNLASLYNCKLHVWVLEPTRRANPVDDRCLVRPRLSDHDSKKLYDHHMGLLKRELLAKGWDRAAETRWQQDESVRDTYRHFAATDQDGSLISISYDLWRLPGDQPIGILAHEWGHALDFLYPAEIAQIVGGRPVLSEPDDRELERWRKRSKDEVEVAADEIVFGVWGRALRYDPRCHLQSFSAGTRGRPRGLR